jgi:hypothetical protein
MMNLDLIVPPCNAIARLAGALGRPTFVARMPVPEWLGCSIATTVRGIPRRGCSDSRAQ